MTVLDSKQKSIQLNTLTVASNGREENKPREIYNDTYSMFSVVCRD